MRSLLKNGLITLLTFSATVNIALLAYAYRHAQEAPATTQARVQIKEGVPAPPLEVTTPEGKTRVIAFGEKPTLLYVISPTCGWCAKNTANINALWKQRSSDHDFVGITLASDGLETYLKKYGIPFAVNTASADTITKYGLGPTPTLLLVKNGKIALNLNGAWVRSRPGLEKAFGVTLPGLNDE